MKPIFSSLLSCALFALPNGLTARVTFGFFLSDVTALSTAFLLAESVSLPLPASSTIGLVP